MTVNKMQSGEEPIQKEFSRCQSCEMRREKLQAIGVAIFFPSLFSFGLLLPFSLIAALVIQSLSLRKCKECRTRAKKRTQVEV